MTELLTIASLALFILGVLIFAVFTIKRQNALERNFIRMLTHMDQMKELHRIRYGETNERVDAIDESFKQWTDAKWDDVGVQINQFDNLERKVSMLIEQRNAQHDRAAGLVLKP